MFTTLLLDDNVTTWAVKMTVCFLEMEEWSQVIDHDARVHDTRNTHMARESVCYNDSNITVRSLRMSMEPGSPLHLQSNSDLAHSSKGRLEVGVHHALRVAVTSTSPSQAEKAQQPTQKPHRPNQAMLRSGVQVR
jgi:hypothetical protein